MRLSGLVVMAAQALEWQSSAHHFRVGLSQRLMRKRGFGFGAFAVQNSKEANHFEVADCVAKRGVRPSDDLFGCHCFPSFLAGRGRAGLPVKGGLVRNHRRVPLSSKTTSTHHLNHVLKTRAGLR